MKKRPKLWIKTGKGPLYIQGDDAVELIMPEEPFRLSDRQPPEQVFPRESLLVTFDISQDGDVAIVEEISKSIELRLKSGVPLTEER